MLSFHRGVVLFFWLASSCAYGEPNSIDAVRASWNQRHQRFANVTLAAEQTALVPKGSLARADASSPPAPPADVELKSSVTMTIQAEAWKAETKGWIWSDRARTFNPLKQTWSWDGQRGAALMDFSATPSGAVGDRSACGDWGLGFNRAVAMCYRPSDVIATGIDLTACRPGDAASVGGSRYTTITEGGGERLVRYYLDADHDYRVVRWENLSDGVRSVVADIDYASVDGAWHPSRFVEQIRRKSGHTTIRTYRFAPPTLGPKRPMEYFTVDFPAGTFVRRGPNPDGAEPIRIDERTRSDGVGEPTRWGGVVFALLAALALACLLGRRLLRKSVNS